MIEKLKNKKVHIAATFGAVAIAGVMLFQGAIPKDARAPKIDAISPDQGVAGTQVVISGSGFTTSVQGIVGTKVKENVYAPGNYVLIKDEAVNQPILSPDGKTLTVRIDLISDQVRRECDDKFSKKDPQPCKVPVKVINAYGKPSNEVHFTITGREIKKLTYTIEKLPMPAPAVIHAVVPGTEWSGDEVMRIRLSAPATNEQTIGGIKLVIATDTGTVGSTPAPCSYFYALNPDPLIGTPVAVGGAWTTNINDPEEVPSATGPIGLDFGLYSGSRYVSTKGCYILVKETDIAPGTHKDLAIHMKMYAQNYVLKADGTYTSPAEQARTFNLLARTSAFYNGAGYYIVDNSPENGYISTNSYYGDGGPEFHMGLSKLITSDPIKIILPSITAYTITATQGTNGTIAPGMTSVRSGGSQIFRITPAAGYQVASVSVDGVNQGPISTYTFTNVTSAHSIRATFAPVSVAEACTLTVSPAPSTPAAQNISPGQTGVTLVKFNATPNCDGTLKSFAVSLLATATVANTNNGYQNISTLRLYNDVTGVQLGTTQSVTSAGMNFPSINIPLTANQTLVLRVVGDISPSAIIGSTVYGAFGGSSGFTDSGGLIGNNASGNLISGNTMTVR